MTGWKQNLTPVQLGTVPTPLERAPRLSEAIGLGPDDLWIKRDDLFGLGGGGNKVRKLQWSCAEAMASGARTLITSGAPQSNHARLTAAAGARLGLDVVLVLAGERPDPGPWPETSLWTPCSGHRSSGRQMMTGPRSRAGWTRSPPSWRKPVAVRR